VQIEVGNNPTKKEKKKKQKNKRTNEVGCDARTATDKIEVAR
jgi:hypothetical protein